MKITLRELEYLLPFDTKVELLGDEEIVGPTELRNIGPRMNYEIIGLYPATKNLLVIRVKNPKEDEREY